VAKRVTKGNLWGFIQSRSYASVADVRRTFSMEVDGATAIPTSEGTCYIGLPPEAAELVGQLSREGRIALDLNLNVKARVVQGIYPVRLPAPRQTSAEGANGAAPKKRRRRRKPAAEAAAE
jgi:hypothetical protein